MKATIWSARIGGHGVIVRALRHQMVIMQAPTSRGLTVFDAKGVLHRYQVKTNDLETRIVA